MSNFDSRSVLMSELSAKTGSRGNAGLMGSEENMEPFPSLPTVLGNHQRTVITTFPPHDDGYVSYTDISIRRAIETFLSGANRICNRKVEMSGSRKVEMSKLPFRQMAEAEIGIFDHEWKRVATHRGPC